MADASAAQPVLPLKVRTCHHRLAPSRYGSHMGMETTSTTVPIGNGPRNEEDETEGLLRSGMRALVILTLAPSPLMRAGAASGQSGMPAGAEAAETGLPTAGSAAVGETTPAEAGAASGVATG